jgi:radical SAM protein with 4Fe4S-binding SPASM domain
LTEEETIFLHIDSLDFSPEEIQSSIQNKRLLSIEIEFIRRCNLQCIYCYANGNPKDERQMPPEKIKEVILQAKELGIKHVTLLGGGEPLLYDNLKEIIDFIDKQGLHQTIFTNGVFLTKELTQFMYRHRVSVVVKYNSRSEEIQDTLTQVSGTYRKIERALENLFSSGYPDQGRLFAIQTVICKSNISELPDLWIWARQNNVIPYFETLTYQGRIKDYPEQIPSIPEVRDLFNELSRIDKDMFRQTWKPHPPIAAFTCQRLLFSCLINVQGEVQPCTGIDFSLGNIWSQPLEKILNENEVMHKIRNICSNIKGKCRECKYFPGCYGCRGNAYQLTGDFLASDPYCWIYEPSSESEEVTG